MTIIKCPSVYLVKLPFGEWINLAQVRRVQVELEPHPVVSITWETGIRTIFHHFQAQAIIAALEESTVSDHSAITLNRQEEPTA